MRKTWIALLLLLIGPFMLFAGQPSPQQNETTTAVTIGQAKGSPEGQMPLTITLAPGRGVEVGSLSMTIRFPVKPVAFLRVELGGVTQGVGAEAKAEVKEEKDEAVLLVTIATPEKDGVRAALPQGPLVDLWFKITQDAKPDTVIPLTVVAAKATGTKAGAEAVKIETHDGQISVSKPIITSCFFYMH